MKNRSPFQQKGVLFNLPIGILLGLTLAGVLPKDKAISAQIAADFQLIVDSLPLSDGDNPTYRKVRVLLPPGFENGADSLPVLYMLDGQNLFDGKTSYAGEWLIDETLQARLTEGQPVPIVVGLDNGGMNRTREYTPFAHPEYGGGKAAEHLDFLSEIAVPWVNKHYPVSQRPELTGIGGSSIGGLFALYASLEKPKVFGFSIVFSPSLWYADSNWILLDHVTIPPTLRSYGYMGAEEGSEDPALSFHVGQQLLNVFSRDFIEAYNTLCRRGWDASHLHWEVIPGHAHQEKYWAAEFPEAIEWWMNELRTNNMLPDANK